MEIYVENNQIDPALGYFEKLLKTGFDNMEFLKKQKTFHQLKNNERFQALIKS